MQLKWFSQNILKQHYNAGVTNITDYGLNTEASLCIGKNIYQLSRDNMEV